jgi:hypothetical protein
LIGKKCEGDGPSDHKTMSIRPGGEHLGQHLHII